MRENNEMKFASEEIEEDTQKDKYLTFLFKESQI